jgi:hypothetical protein
MSPFLEIAVEIVVLRMSSSDDDDDSSVASLCDNCKALDEAGQDVAVRDEVLPTATVADGGASQQQPLPLQDAAKNQTGGGVSTAATKTQAASVSAVATKGPPTSAAATKTQAPTGSPSAAPTSSAGKVTFLFAFDFDHTIVDANSDMVIQKVFHSGPIPERVRIVAKHQGWTTFMQEVFRFHYANHVTKTMFCDTLFAMGLFTTCSPTGSATPSTQSPWCPACWTASRR